MATITIGANTYDAYESVANAIIYFGGRLGSSAWDDASTDDQGRGLIMATNLIDRQVWAGEKTASDQTFAFPRTSLTDKYGDAVSSATVPTDVVNAHYEWALLLLKDVTAQDSTGAVKRVKSLTSGPVSVEFNLAANSSSARFPQVIQEMLGQYLVAKSTGAAYGTDQTSAFSEDDDVVSKSELSEGLQ